jgi:hypothetical protein
MAGPQRRAEILDALRRGTVPREGLAAFAVGMEKFEVAIDAELAAVALGRGGFKAVRGEYGSGKTFFARWLQERARASHGFATSEVQVSETETPLHRWETVYRRLAERLATADTPDGALRSIVDAWFYTLEEDVLASGKVDPGDAKGLLAATDALVEQRLSVISRTAPAFSAVLRAFRRALVSDDTALAEGLIAWLSVVAAPEEGRARWLGGGRPASYALCRSVEEVVAGAHPGCELSRRAASKLEQIREQLSFVEGTKIPIVDNGQDNFSIWTFGGGLTNAALAEALPVPTARSDDFCISIKARSATTIIDAFSKIDGLCIQPSISSALIRELKFTSCLPEKIAASTIGARLLDRDGIKATLARETLVVIGAQ